MSITIDIDPELLRQAQAALKVDDPSELVRRLATRAIELHAIGGRLAALGGTMPDLDIPPRARPAVK